jgi:hypothetical protein
MRLQTDHSAKAELTFASPLGTLLGISHNPFATRSLTSAGILAQPPKTFMEESQSMP